MKRKFSNNFEFFDYVNSLILKLEELGETNRASEFRDAMMISSLPGEVLGELYLKFIDLAKTAIPLQLGLEEDIKAIISDLKSILSAK